jgi:hypothetical protein
MGSLSEEIWEKKCQHLSLYFHQCWKNEIVVNAILKTKSNKEQEIFF